MKKTFLALLVVLSAAVFYGCDFEKLDDEPGEGPRTVSAYLSDLSLIPPPAKNAPPMRSFDMPEYTGTIVWKNQNGETVSGNFAEGSKYDAYVSLAPKNGFTFDGFSGTFFHRGAAAVSQSVSSNPDSAAVVIGFNRLLLTDADFVSLTGTRLKTFRMTPDASWLESQRGPFKFSGSKSETIEAYSSKATRSIAYSNYLSLEKDSPNLLQLYSPGGFPEDYTLPFTITYFFCYFRDSQYQNETDNITVSSNISPPFTAYDLDYDRFDPEPFSSDSYIVPEKGYTADKNFLEYHYMAFPPKTVTGAQLRQIVIDNHGLTYVHEPRESYFCDVTLPGFSATAPCRQISKDYYLYRTISVSYDPAFEIIGWQGGPLVDRFTMDESTNTLTAHMKDYYDNTLGDIFSFYVISEDGLPHRKFVSVGY